MKKIIGIIAGASVIMVALVLVTPEVRAAVSPSDPGSCQTEPVNKLWVCTVRNTTTGACTTAECRSTARQAEQDRATTETNVTSVSDFQTLLQNIIGWVQVFFYIIATLMIILAAYDYLSSGGSEEKVKAAKQRVIYAIIAIAIAVIAGGVVRLVQTFVG